MSKPTIMDKILWNNIPVLFLKFYKENTIEQHTLYRSSSTLPSPHLQCCTSAMIIGWKWMFSLIFFAVSQVYCPWLKVVFICLQTWIQWLTIIWSHSIGRKGLEKFILLVRIQKVLHWRRHKETWVAIQEHNIIYMLLCFVECILCWFDNLKVYHLPCLVVNAYLNKICLYLIYSIRIGTSGKLVWDTANLVHCKNEL